MKKIRYKSVNQSINRPINIPITTGVNTVGDAGDTTPPILVWGTSMGTSPPISLHTLTLAPQKSEYTKICHFDITKQKKFWQGHPLPTSHSLWHFVPQPCTRVDATADYSFIRNAHLYTQSLFNKLSKASATCTCIRVVCSDSPLGPLWVCQCSPSD